MESIARTAARRLYQLREKKNLTQEEVGQLIDRSGGHISNVENGKAELSFSELEKLATAWGVHPLNLIAGLSPGVCEMVDMTSRMSPEKRRQALKLFRLSIDLMDIAKNWPAETGETS